MSNYNVTVTWITPYSYSVTYEVKAKTPSAAVDAAEKLWQEDDTLDGIDSNVDAPYIDSCCVEDSTGNVVLQVVY